MTAIASASNALSARTVMTGSPPDVDSIFPVYRHGVHICGRLIYRSVQTQFGRIAELFVEIEHQGWTMLVPCRRVNRQADPEGVYILADGSVWTSPETAPQPIVAEVVRVPGNGEAYKG
jgi:hypothetical protein